MQSSTSLAMIMFYRLFQVSEAKMSMAPGGGGASGFVM